MKLTHWLLRCYPRHWRERYQEEMLALLEQHRITPKTAIDLFLGALDARLNSVYRSKGGWMLQQIRDQRTLAFIYLGALAVFSLSSSLWVFLTILSPLHFQTDETMGAIANNLGISLIESLVPLISLIVLVRIACLVIAKACKKRQWSVLAFALFCLGATFWMVWLVPWAMHLSDPVSFFSHLSLMNKLEFVLSDFLPIFLFGSGLFITGIEGLKMLRARRGRSLLFALLIGLLPPISGVLFFLFAFRTSTGSSLAATLSLACFLFCFMSGQFLELSAFSLTLATGTLTQRSWQIVRMCGLVLTFLLLTKFLTIVLWDVNNGIERGSMWLFDPLIINALILGVALAYMFLAVLRSFVLPAAEGRLPIHASESAETARIPS